MKNRSFVRRLAKCLCAAVLALGFTLSVVGCAEQAGDMQQGGAAKAKACPPGCKMACCAKKSAKKCPPDCKKACCAKKAEKAPAQK